MALTRARRCHRNLRHVRSCYLFLPRISRNLCLALLPADVSKSVVTGQKGLREEQQIFRDGSLTRYIGKSSGHSVKRKGENETKIWAVLKPNRPVQLATQAEFLQCQDIHALARACGRVLQGRTCGTGSLAREPRVRCSSYGYLRRETGILAEHARVMRLSRVFACVRSAPRRSDNRIKIRVLGGV